ncbi:aspartate aminotransferase, cytoplasmic [Trichomonascus vanleenenianus]|uniref:aspartate transaminase AAT2 n=1 Tax=Trichomonascus vanleenenianus TaxID=2268995 RepID=UPI003ECB0269
MTADKMSQFAGIATIPGDPLFELVARYKADTFDKKVDLSIGAYRDDTGHPWVLPVVKKVDSLVSSDPTLDHEYLPITGLADFTAPAARLVLGKKSDVVKAGHVASVQTISGTGANHLGALFLARHHRSKVIYIPDPTWANHRAIFENVGLTVKTYPYFDKATRGLAFDDMLAALEQANDGDIILLHACAHNPTGVDPSQEQWTRIAEVVKRRNLFTFFDTAYQGFASGDLDRDAWAVQHFAQLGFEMMVCQSFSKNFGLYGQRTGALHVVMSDPAARTAVISQLAKLQRAEISNPPAYGARIVARVLNSESLFEEWVHDLNVMSSRIIAMRHALRDRLVQLGTPGTWDHIVNQIGMFSFTGLAPELVDRLVNEFHIYLSRNGRISMAGLNTHNVDYVAQCIDKVVRGN